MKVDQSGNSASSQTSTPVQSSDQVRLEKVTGFELFSTHFKTTTLAKAAKIFVVLVCCSILGLQALFIWREREVQLRETDFAAANLARAVSQQVESSMLTSDVVLDYIVEWMENPNKSTVPADTQLFIARHTREIPFVHSVVLIDEVGRPLSDAAGIPVVEKKLSSDAQKMWQSQFQGHRTHIGLPFKNQADQQWLLSLSRPWFQANGKFGGVISLNLNLEYFNRYLQQFEIGSNGAIFIASTSGVVLIRRPFEDKSMGRDVSTFPLFSTYLPKASSGTARFTSQQDGISRINSYHRLEKYPLVVSAALAQDEALAEWSRDVLIHSSAAMMLVAMFVLVGYRLIRQIEKAAETQAELYDSRSDLQKLNVLLEGHAKLDGLTGLSNRRFFDESLLSEHARATRNGASLAVIMIDIDYFKQYNDTYGHTYGDECLKRVSEAAKSCIRRASDMCARYGGEEIVLLLPGTDLKGAQVVAENVRESIARLRLEHKGSPEGKITISAGVYAAVPNPSEQEPMRWIKAADEALYEAKANGRNKVYLARVRNSDDEDKKGLRVVN